MPRLFTGFELPPAIAQQLAMARGGLPGARWVDPADYHITLRFIGDISGRMASEVDAELAGLGGEPPLITIRGLDTFGGDKPRAILASVEPSRRLMEAQSEQERLLRRFGLPPDTRKYTPHVTLAWLRAASVLDVADFLSVRGGFPPMVFRPERVVLYSAREQTGGGPYVVEATYPFVVGMHPAQHRYAAL